MKSYTLNLKQNRFSIGCRRIISKGVGLAGRVRQLPWTLRAFVLLLAVIPFGIGIGWTFRTKKLNNAPASLYRGRNIVMELTMQTVDPLAEGGILSVSWSIIDDYCFEHGSPYNCSNVNIYMDSNLFVGSANPNITLSTTIPSTPIFSWDPAGLYNVYANLAVFQTKLAIRTRFAQWRDTLVNYPFDQYAAEIFMFARANDTDEIVGINVAQTDGVAFGFDTSIVPLHDLSVDSGVYGSSVAYDSKHNGTLDLFLVIQRTSLVKAYVMVLIGAMWLIALLLVGIALKAILFRIPVEPTILVVPVATLFAFTTLRSSMSPSGFGANIDFVGTLPSIALLVGATVLCLLHTLIRKDEKHMTYA